MMKHLEEIKALIAGSKIEEVWPKIWDFVKKYELKSQESEILRLQSRWADFERRKLKGTIDSRDERVEGNQLKDELIGQIGVLEQLISGKGKPIIKKKATIRGVPGILLGIGIIAMLSFILLKDHLLPNTTQTPSESIVLDSIDSLPKQETPELPKISSPTTQKAKKVITFQVLNNSPIDLTLASSYLVKTFQTEKKWKYQANGNPAIQLSISFSGRILPAPEMDGRYYYSGGFIRLGKNGVYCMGENDPRFSLRATDKLGNSQSGLDRLLAQNIENIIKEHINTILTFIDQCES